MIAPPPPPDSRTPPPAFHTRRVRDEVGSSIEMILASACQALAILTIWRCAKLIVQTCAVTSITGSRENSSHLASASCALTCGQTPLRSEGAEADVLRKRHLRHLLSIRMDHRNPRIRSVAGEGDLHGNAVNQGLAGVGLGHTRGDAQRLGLAHAILAQQFMHLAGLHGRRRHGWQRSRSGWGIAALWGRR